MAKPNTAPAAKPQTKAAPTAPATTGDNSGIDITKLSPSQLAALQKQLKEKRAATTGKTKERFVIIDTMLAEKDEEGKFKHTTRDICNALEKERLVDPSIPGFDQIEIKKIQARKQFLEKRTDEKGQLVTPKGTYGYKASAFQLGSLTTAKVVEFFSDKENIARFTNEQKDAVRNALS